MVVVVVAVVVVVCGIGNIYIRSARIRKNKDGTGNRRGRVGIHNGRCRSLSNGSEPTKTFV